MSIQTQGIPKSRYILEISINGVDWMEVSGESTKVSYSGGDQQTGSTNTAGGSAPIVVHSNKTAAITAQCDIVYSEAGWEAFGIVWATWLSPEKSLYMRYSPVGLVGSKRFYTADDADDLFRAPLVSCLPPEGDSTTGDPMMAMFSLLTPKMAEEIIT